MGVLGRHIAVAACRIRHIFSYCCEEQLTSGTDHSIEKFLPFVHHLVCFLWPELFMSVHMCVIAHPPKEAGEEREEVFKFRSGM